MDNQRAINILIYAQNSFDECSYGAIKIAIDMAIEALEKQIPDRPELKGDGYWDGELIYDTGYCPRCHQDYEIEYHAPKFCENCGQALYWG